MSAQLCSGELSVEIVGDLLWGGYLRAVKCDCLVLSLGRRFTIYCLDSSPQFCRVCLMINVITNCLHYCVLYSFVILVTSSFISGMAGEVESLDLRSSRALIFSNISVGTGSVLSRCRPEGMWCDTALRIMTRKVFSPFWQLVGSHLLLSMSSISLLYRSQFSFSD